jgi:CubicO group peptidase (beta-lactamase class C family)
MLDQSLLENIPEDDFSPISAKVIDEMNRLPIPGAVVGISHADRQWIAAFGTTSLDHPLPVTENTLFQIGSITKTFVTTAVMRLVEMGQLDLDQPIRTYLPDLKLRDEAVAARVTMRHLLTHTGGWVGDYFNDFGPGENALATMVAKMADLEQLTPLGEVWSYNNSGFYLAGRVIEVIMDTNFEAAMQQLVLDPLGLKMTFFFAQDVITHRFAVGHEVVDKRPKVARPWAIGRAAHSAGGVICSMPDLLRYARFHMGDGTTPDGTRLLSPQSMAQMQTPLFPSTGISMIGLSWSIITIDDTRLIGHGGGTNGQTTLLRIVPSKKFAVAVFTNSDEGDTLCVEIVNSATKRFVGIGLPEAVPLELPEEHLQLVVGKYDSASEMLDIYVQDGRLMLQPTYKGGFPTPESPPPQSPEPMKIAFYAEDRIIVLDEPMKDSRGELLRNPDNSIAWLRLGGRIHARQD